MCEGTKGLRRKVWTWTKILILNIYVILSRFTHFFEISGQKSAILGQEVHYYMVYIAFYTELNWQICNYAQKRRICRENSKYTFYEHFMAIFALAERLPTPATLGHRNNYSHQHLWLLLDLRDMYTY